MTQKKVIGKVVVLGARLSFASLFEMNRQKQDDGTVRETWKANLLVPKTELKKMFGKFEGVKMPLQEALKLAGNEAKEKKWGPEAKWPKLKPDRTYFRDGDLEDWDGYAGHYYISANAQPADRPAVLTNRKDADNKWIEAQPGGKAAPYSGCYVNATLVVWCQDNEHGKRLNAQVKAIQFVRDGEAFGAAPTDPNEDFDDDDSGSEGDFGNDGDDDGDDDMV